MAKFVATMFVGAFTLILLSGCTTSTAQRSNAAPVHDQAAFGGGGGGGGEGGGY